MWSTCSHLRLKTVKSDDALITEGFTSPGKIYFLLRGGINVMGTGGQKVIDTYRPVVQFVDCEYALQPDIPNEKEKDTKARIALQATCNNTLVSLAPQFRSGLKSSALWVTNFPWDATAKDLMLRFAEFGADPDMAVRRVEIWETEVNPESSARGQRPSSRSDGDGDDGDDVEGGGAFGGMRWAAVEFAEWRDSLLATREDVAITMRGLRTRELAEKYKVVRKPAKKKSKDAADQEEDEEIDEFILRIEGEVSLPGAKDRPVSPPFADTPGTSSMVDAWPKVDAEGRPTSESGKKREFLDVDGSVFAVLSREDYIDNTITYIQRIIGILKTDVKERTVEHLETLEQMFDNSAIFNVLDRSARTSGMLRRNICRYVGVEIVDSSTKGLPKQGALGKKMFVVLSGELTIDQGELSETVVTAGHPFGQEVLVNPEKVTYSSTITCRDHAVLAVLYKDDYTRAANTAGVQHVIGQFWDLGVQHSNDEIEVDSDEEEEKDFLFRAFSDIHAKEALPDAEPIFTYAGYCQLYPRIAKVLAPKDKFSARDRKREQPREWENDKERFGSPSRDYLTREEFSKSMYELIDEWCGAVESVQLFERLLEIIFENITIAKADLKKNKKKKKKKKEEEDNPEPEIELVLRPMKMVECRFQQMMDVRYAMSKKVKANQTESSMVQQQTKRKRMKTQKIDLSKLVANKSVLGAPGEKSGRSNPKALIEYYKAMFDSIDADESGYIDRQELALLAEKVGRDMSESELNAAMVEMDSDGSGEIEFDEFFAWFSDAMENDTMTREAFDRADADGSGAIDREEGREVMKELGHGRVGKMELDNAMREMDDDSSGEVEFEEFRQWWDRQTALAILANSGGGPDPQEVYLRKQFDEADDDASGCIDRDELEGLLITLGRPLAGPELTIAFAIMDEDSSGEIEWFEFKNWFTWLQKEDLSLCRIFNAVDKDGSGSLDRDEVTWVIEQLNQEHEEQIDVDEAISLMDADEDGEVDKIEFSNWWTRHHLDGTEAAKDAYMRQLDSNHYKAGIKAHERDLKNLSGEIGGDFGDSEDVKKAALSIQSSFRMKKMKSKVRTMMIFSAAASEGKAAREGDWKRGRSKVSMQLQMYALDMPPPASQQSATGEEEEATGGDTESVRFVIAFIVTHCGVILAQCVAFFLPSELSLSSIHLCSHLCG